MLRIDPVQARDLPDLLPMLRAYCDFYAADPPDHRLEALARHLIAHPAEGAQLIARGEAGETAGELRETPGEPQRATGESIDAPGDPRDAPGEPLGFATVYLSWGTLIADRVAVMYDLFVRPEHRGKGVADALIEACRALARERGARVMTWQTAPDNLRAQAVYERVGARREQWVDYWLAVD